MLRRSRKPLRLATLSGGEVHTDDMKRNKKVLAIPIYLTSLVFFVLGFMHPLTKTEIFMGVWSNEIYLWGSVELLLDKEEYFLGILILLFSIIFPILKYVVVASKILGIKFPYTAVINLALEIINKWAMLDVYVVALLILSIKMGNNDILIWTGLGTGITYFAISILGLLISTFIMKEREAPH